VKSMTTGILVCAETLEGRVTATTKELLHAGRLLADAVGQPLAALLAGRNTQAAAAEVIALGADTAYTVDAPAYIESTADYFTNLLFHACQKIDPAIVVFGQTDMGRDVAPLLAAKTGAAISMDCVGVAVDAGTKALFATRPVYGGNALAVWSSGVGDALRIVALRPRSYPAAEPDAARQGKVVALEAHGSGGAARVELLETNKEEIKGIKIEDARIVVSGGGGIGGPDGFAMLAELARIAGGAGGAVAATRVPCDEGWVSHAIEVGQTGTIITPDLYIAVGISGAVQHMVGCASAKVIVAINRDADAHIFEEADFGIIGDYRQAVPALTGAIAGIKGA
jgi:electron transfer flavoprotein alpha subunit